MQVDGMTFCGVSCSSITPITRYRGERASLMFSSLFLARSERGSTGLPPERGSQHACNACCLFPFGVLPEASSPLLLLLSHLDPRQLLLSASPSCRQVIPAAAPRPRPSGFHPVPSCDQRVIRLAMDHPIPKFHPDCRRDCNVASCASAAHAHDAKSLVVHTLPISSYRWWTGIARIFSRNGRGRPHTIEAHPGV
jgi:hypothetical protein